MKTPDEYLFFAEQVIAEDQYHIGAMVEARKMAEILRSLGYEPIQQSLLS